MAPPTCPRNASRILQIVLVIAAIAIAAPASASGEVTLGPADLSVPGNTAYGCQSGLTGVCSFVHLPGAAFTAAAPWNGIITVWRFRGGCCVPAQTVDRTAKLRVFRQTSTQEPYYRSARAVRTGPSFVVKAGGVLGSNAVVEVPARLRIDAGEVVGVDTEHSFDFNGYGGAQLLFLQPAPADGAESYGNTFGAIAMNVDVEPDADGDGYGDETQDCEPADPAKQGGCTQPPGPAPVSPLPVFKPGPCESNCGGGGAVFSGVPAPAPAGDGLSVFIPVACPTGHTGVCGGFLVAALPGANSAATSAKARRVVLGRTKFSVAPGQKKKVRIRFNRKARRLFARKRTRMVVITMQPDGGDPISVRRKITFRKRR